MLRLPIPEMTQERRKELSKLAGQYAEKARVAVRNVRRDGMDNLKADENKKEISEDERKRHETEVQKLTDATIAELDAAATAKEKEILGSCCSGLTSQPFELSLSKPRPFPAQERTALPQAQGARSLNRKSG